jgi:hypothetical protein
MTIATADDKLCKIRLRAREGRECHAAEFFKNWRTTLLKVSRQGFLRWQFQQTVPVSFHDTNAAAKVTKAMAQLGLQTAWAARCLDKNHPANPFGQPIWIKELRVWWHDGPETWQTPTFSNDMGWEGVPSSTEEDAS